MIVGMDIGGANLKLAVLGRTSENLPFPMWKQPDQLSCVLKRWLSVNGMAQEEVTGNQSHEFAVTMTGEMADCFASRAEGVRYILEQVQLVCGNGRTHVYTVDGTWSTPMQSMENPWDVASSNWHATANWFSRSEHSPENEVSIVVDIGSTTTDITPVQRERVLTNARTDRDRLQSAQLVYTGVERTPIAAVVRMLRVGEEICPVMAERFADSQDAYTVLGSLESASDAKECDTITLDTTASAATDTADGRPRTYQYAAARLARMVGEDADLLHDEVIRSIADQIVSAQASQIARAIKHVAQEFGAGPNVYFVGHGGALLGRIQDELQVQSLRVDDFGSRLSDSISRCMPAYAVASLLEQDIRLGRLAR